MGKKDFFEKLRKNLVENKLPIAIFLLVTTYFIIQNLKYLGWDFSAYLLNARYWFWGGTYFEELRPPLVPLILGLLGILGEFGARIAYIALCSGFFLISNIVISKEIKKRLKIKETNQIFTSIFYTLSLGFISIKYGLLEGSEILAISFFILFISQIIKGKNSGYLLGFSILTKYVFIYFTPLLLISKNPKKILANIGTFFVAILPWLIYNKIVYGNWFSSIVSSLTLNVLNRQEIFQPFNWGTLVIAMGFSAPLILVGTYSQISEIIKKKNLRVNLIFIGTIFLTICSIVNTPLKIPRFYFNLSFPFAFFSTIGLIKIKTKLNLEKKYLLIPLTILILSLSASYISDLDLSDQDFKMAANDLSELDFLNCSVLSGDWTQVGYYTENTYYLPTNWENQIKRGKILLIFSPQFSPKEEIEKIQKYSRIKRENYEIFFQKNITKENCENKKIFSSPYSQRPCKDLGRIFKPFETVCEILN